MVMFHEDDRRIIEAARAAQPRWYKRLKLALKIIGVLTFLFFMSLIAMSMVGGNGDPLRRGMEAYIRGATGYEAEIDHLQNMQFFPDVIVDFDDLTLYQSILPKGGQAAKPLDMPVHGGSVARVTHAAVSMAFWDLFFVRNRIEVLDIEDARVDKGILSPKPIRLDEMKLDKKSWQGGPGIAMKGTYGDDAFEAGLQMQLKSPAHPVSYGVPDTAGFTAGLGSLKMAGTLGHEPGRGLRVDIAALSLGDDRIASGQMTLASDPDGLALDAHLTSGHSRFTGSMKQAALDFSVLDASDIGPLLKLAATIADAWPTPWQPHVTVAALQEDSKAVGTLKGALAAAPNGFLFSDAGTIDAGLLTRWGAKPGDIACFMAGLKPDGAVLDPVLVVVDGKPYTGRGHAGAMLDLKLAPAPGQFKLKASLPADSPCASWASP